jgi:hypothetical protein
VRDEGHGYLRKGRLPDLQRLPEKRDGEAAAVARAVAGTRQGARPQLGQPRPGTRHYRSDGKTTPRTRILFSTNFRIGCAEFYSVKQYFHMKAH